MQTQNLTSAQLRLLALSALILLGFTGLVFEYHSLIQESIITNFGNPVSLWQPPTESTSPAASNLEFWSQFAPVLAAGDPKCPEPELVGKAAAKLRTGEDIVDVGNYVEMEKADVELMRKLHAWVIDQIQHRDLALPYKESTHGIVTSAGASYFPPLIVSLRFLRRTGSEIPVEVFLATPDEFERLICNVILPSLNAKCIILSDIIDEFDLPFSFSKYQLKVFAILFSSFESVLFLDADNFPVESPDSLFVEEPFLSHHMVLWPDYWAPTVSPLYSTISGLEETLLAGRTTVEAGQILISKKYHTTTLLLAAYYNCYGTYFYHLMSQGGPGEGDKETFADAALVLGAPFYDVKQRPRPLGISGDGAAVLQAHPTDDWNRTRDHSIARPLFIHASWPPKLNALHNFQTRRQWGTAANSKRLFGVDIEPIAWGFMIEMACDQKIQFREWGNKSEHGICERTKRSYLDMFKKEYGSSS
ncbi:Alpha-1,2-mannosyltransferase MNN23 [Phlyctema vagabunda]|uniref:Alpha-1,2-mannosyltransferase MNN23 n=1 Tax=Phlyctema vagabunda TaxID=108571 RepID=A0ABR4PQA5_9HELO